MIDKKTMSDLIAIVLHGGADFVEFRIPQDSTYSYSSLDGSSVLDVRWSTNRTRFHELLDNAQ